MKTETFEMLLKLIERMESSNSEPAEASEPLANDLIGKYVIVRCRDAGVHAGILKGYQGREVYLTNSRRLWYWVAAKGHTLNAVAEFGIKQGSKIPAPVSSITLLEACEIIETTGEAEDIISGFDVHEVD